MKHADSSPSRKSTQRENHSVDQRPFNIRERAFEFSIRIIKLVNFLDQRNLMSRSITGQLIRSGTSVGANLEEAVASESRRDFAHKYSIALKEARETNYWLRIIRQAARLDNNAVLGLSELERESSEIKKILGKIVSKTKER